MKVTKEKGEKEIFYLLVHPEIVRTARLDQAKDRNSILVFHEGGETQLPRGFSAAFPAC